MVDEGRSFCSIMRIKKLKDLYGFDNGKEYCFMKIVFRNMTAFNKVKKYWYTDTKNYRKRTCLVIPQSEPYLNTLPLPET